MKKTLTILTMIAVLTASMVHAQDGQKTIEGIVINGLLYNPVGGANAGSGIPNDNSVTSIKIANGSVTNADFAPNSVTNDKISASGSSGPLQFLRINPIQTGTEWVDFLASYAFYNNAISGLDATNLQDAIDKLSAITLNQSKGAVLNEITVDGAFTTENIRISSGVDISRPVTNIVKTGNINYTLGDLGETSGSLDAQMIYVKIEGNTATLTIDSDTVDFYAGGNIIDNQKIFLDAGDEVVFENNSLGGWDISGSYNLIDGFTADPYAANANPNIVTGALAFGTSATAPTINTAYTTDAVATVVTVVEHPYANIYGVRITSPGGGSNVRVGIEFAVTNATNLDVGVARRVAVGTDGRYRFASGATTDANTFFTNTTDFVVDEFSLLTNSTVLRVDLYAQLGTADAGDASEFFIIIKNQ